MPRSLITALIALLLASCVTPTSPDHLDRAARDYVRLQLAIGEKEDGYIDAYYGPGELRAEAKALAARSSLTDLSGQADALEARVYGHRAEEPRRAAFLLAQLTAAQTRLRMLRGEKLRFVDEARGLFGVTPQLKPLSAYDPVLARIERLVPGLGDLATRVDAFQDRFVIPADRLKAVFDSAIAGCRQATIEHIALPPTERFDLSFVTGKSWSGYNYYQGGYHSRIEVNTDLPIRISRAIDLGCHEGYPGHHVLNTLLEEKLVRGRGWTEFSVYPLFSPQSLIAEGSANYGIDLAFPAARKLRYETAVLYPQAGLSTADAARYDALLDAMRELAGARITLAQMLLDGDIGDDEAIRLTRKYQLVSGARARQSISFTKQYRSYVINYGLGRDMIAADVEREDGNAARWQRMEQLLSEPTLPSDLRVR
ncbi:hypothetical protein OMW55_08825 [Sphingomonas sp. BN140010]|uniref:DUF885 domain-containing protein n=1 Tax=Sphingomonas arvum TaxID=2992113 RepID=A0ABT3JGJ3_9SPHN|nr:hypothetical protein [Sphingomonas sp. BN140010]MCW3797906.1 hypothetical protein [Sphingomonas sp. BN140010]